MREAFEFEVGGIRDNIFADVPLLEFALTTLGQQIVIAAVDNDAHAAAVLDTTGYQTYLTDIGIDLTTRNTIVSRLAGPPELVIGMTNDIVTVATGDHEDISLTSVLAPINGMDLYALIASTKNFINGNLDVTGGTDGTGYPITADAGQTLIRTLADLLGTTPATSTFADPADDPSVMFIGYNHYPTIIANGGAERVGGYYKAVAGNMMALVFQSALVPLNRIQFTVDCDTLVPISKAYSSPAGTTFQFNAAVTPRMANQRTAMLQAMNLSGTFDAVKDTGLFGGATTIAAAIAAYTVAPFSTRGFVLDLSDNMKLVSRPVGASAFAFHMPLADFIATSRGIDARVTYEPEYLFYSMHTSTILQVYDAMAEDTSAAELILQDDPGTVRLVAYKNPIAVPQNIVSLTTGYLKWKEVKDEGGEVDDYWSTKVTTDEMYDWQMIQDNVNKLVSVSASVLKTTVDPLSTYERKMLVVAQEEPYHYTVEVYCYDAEGTCTYKIIRDSDSAEEVLPEFDFLTLYKNTNGLIKMSTAVGSFKTYTEVFQILYGTVVVSEIVASMDIGPIEPGTNIAYDYTYAETFMGGRWPNLFHLTGDRLLKGIILTEGLGSTSFKRFLSMMLVTCPSDALYSVSVE
jgi:hypothetical protein